MRSPQDPARDDEILRQYKKGATRKELATTFTLTRERVSQILRAQGINGRRTGPRRPVSVTVITTLEVQATVRRLAEMRKTSVSQLLNGWIEERLKVEVKRSAKLPEAV